MTFSRQEALQAAICEKDANIALLEMTSTKKQRNMEEIDKLSREKDKLNQQLKELVKIGKLLTFCFYIKVLMTRTLQLMGYLFYKEFNIFRA